MHTHLCWCCKKKKNKRGQKWSNIKVWDIFNSVFLVHWIWVINLAGNRKTAVDEETVFSARALLPCDWRGSIKSRSVSDSTKISTYTVNQIFLILKPFSVSDGCSTTVKQADLSIDLGGLELAGKSTFAYWFFVPFLFLQVGSGQGHHPKSKSCSTFSILLVTHFAQRQPVPASQSWSSWKGLHLRSGNLASKVRKSWKCFGENCQCCL